MRAVRGYLDNGRFTPYDTITMPKKAEVTLLFRDSAQPDDDEKLFWTEFDRMAVESSDENYLLNDEAFSRRDSGRDLTAFLSKR